LLSCSVLIPCLRPLGSDPDEAAAAAQPEVSNKSTLLSSGPVCRRDERSDL
jgi:hypothetical protein